MNTSSMHVGENPLLKHREHCSWIKRLLVTRVTPKAKYQRKVKAHSLANAGQGKQGQRYSHQRSQN